MFPARIFVYGSLLSGEPNHGLLRQSRSCGAARTLPRYELRSLGGFPGLIDRGTCVVEGEIYEVDAGILSALDQLEGHPGYYRRLPVLLADKSKAEAYLLPARYAFGCPSIPSGSWRTHLASTPPIPQQLDALIDEIYQIFSGYQRPSSSDACRCCVDARDHRELHEVPLRRLTVERLSRYAFKAMTTWGDADEFRHFLPRILDLMARERGGLMVDEAILLGKLSVGGWRTWPEHEIEIIERYCRLLWAAVLDDPGSFGTDASGLLCALSCVFDDLAPFLKAWDAHPSQAATAQLATLEDVYGERLRTSPPDDLGFWKNPGAAQIAAWLDTPETQARIRSAPERE